MNGIGALRALLLLPWLSVTLGQESLCDQRDPRTIYEFQEELLDGSRNVSLAEFRGKVRLLSIFVFPVFSFNCLMTICSIISVKMKAGMVYTFELWANDNFLYGIYG